MNKNFLPMAIVASTAIVSATTYFIFKVRGQNKAKVEAAEIAAKSADHLQQMANNPAYADAYNKAAKESMQRQADLAAQREEQAAIRERVYNSEEAVQRRQRENLINMEQDLIRRRERQHRDAMDDLIDLSRSCNHYNCNCCH